MLGLRTTEKKSQRAIRKAAKKAATRFRRPDFLASFQDIERRRHEPPRCAGLYGWYFDKVSVNIHGRGCVTTGGWLRTRRTLLYVGISNNLYRRVVQAHFRGRLASSLRQKITSLYSVETSSEDWMQQHGRVFWLDVDSRPLRKSTLYTDPLTLIRHVEKLLIQDHLVLPLNVQHNVRDE